MGNSSIFTISHLIENIDDASLIKNILSDFEEQLRASGEFDIRAIFPILTQKIEAVDEAYQTSLLSLSKSHQSVEDVMTFLDASTITVSEIYNTSQALDNGPSLLDRVQELKDTSDVINESAKEIQKYSNQELLDATAKVGIPNILATHKTISSQIITSSHSDRLITEQVAKFSDELHGDVRSLSTNALRNLFKPFAKNIVDFSVKAKELQDYISKRKAANPLISNDLVNYCVTLSQNMEPLTRLFERMVNLFYVHSQDLIVLNNAVLVYQQLADRVVQVNEEPS